MTFVKATTVGVMMAVVAMVAFTVCEFAVKYALSVAQATADGTAIGGAAIGFLAAAGPVDLADAGEMTELERGASMAIPSPLSVLAAVAGFAYGYRWTLKRASAHEAH